VCTSSTLCLLPTIPHGPYFRYSSKLLTHLTVSSCRLYSRDLHGTLYARVFTRYCYPFLRPQEDNKPHTHTHTQRHAITSDVCWTVNHCDSWRIQNQLDRTSYFYFTSWRLNMFRALICPSSGLCDYIAELSHWLFRSWFAVCWSLGADRLGWFPGCRLKLNWHPDTTPADPHPNFNTQQTKNETANVIVQQYSRILLKMGILMPETCWVSKK